MLLAAGLNKRVGLGLLAGCRSWRASYRHGTTPDGSSRDVFCDDSSATQVDDYHIMHAKIAIGSGGLTGVGIGNSVQATGYLPEVINDSVFAVMGEIFGFVGLVAILAIFTALTTADTESS